MATPSIFHNVIIDDPETAERFITAPKESEKENRTKSIGPARPVLKDHDEIQKLLVHRKKSHEG